MMLIKDGMSARTTPSPRRYFDEPVRKGPRKERSSLQEEFDSMLDEYYNLHGWDGTASPRRGR